VTQEDPVQPSFPLWVKIVLPTASIAIPVLAWLVLRRYARRSAPAVAVWSAVFVALWLALAFTLSARGFFSAASASVPPIALALVPLVLGYVAYLSSRSLRAAIAEIPLQWMIGLQLYRALGVVFLVEWSLGAVPGAFALPAGLGDMAVGLTAPIVAALVARRAPGARGAAILWNVLGIADLVVAVTLGVLTSPGALQHLAFDAPNRAITMLPLVLVPTIAVPLSLLLHLIGMHRLVGAARDDAGRTPSMRGIGVRASSPVHQV
jgi:hypothetical protein